MYLSIHSKVLIRGLGPASPVRLLVRLHSALRCALLARIAKKKSARQSDNAPVGVFPLDLGGSGAPGTPPRRSGAQFSRPKRRFLRCFLLQPSTFPLTSRPLRNTAWAHEIQASGFSRSSQHRAKTRFESCSEKGSQWQGVRQGPRSNPRGLI